MAEQCPYLWGFARLVSERAERRGVWGELRPPLRVIVVATSVYPIGWSSLAPFGTLRRGHLFVRRSALHPADFHLPPIPNRRNLSAATGRLPRPAAT